jgi:hypothetical protein
VALRVVEDFGEDASHQRCPAYIFTVDGLVRKPVTTQTFTVPDSMHVSITPEKLKDYVRPLA